MSGISKILRQSGEDATKNNEKGLPNRWKVYVSKESDHIRMQLAKGLMVPIESYIWFIYPPNYVEKLLGITFQNKVDKTHKKANRIADKLNDREDALTHALEEIIK